MIFISRTVGLIANPLSGNCGPIGSRKCGGRHQGRIITTAIAGVLALLMVTAGAHADSITDDLIPMLDAPHPFAQVRLPTSVPYSRTPYSETVPGPAPANKPVTADTLVALFGLTAASKAPPAQVVNSSPAAGSAPQIAAAGLLPVKSDDPSFITIGGGWFDIFDNEDAAEFRVEWRSNRLFWIFKPFAGAMFTSDAAIYGFGGFLTDFYFGRRIVVSPSIAVGLYEDIGGKDLGSVIEFRSGLEIGWRFDNRARLSAMFYHLSNAGITDKNPGTEVFSIGYSFPLD